MKTKYKRVFLKKDDNEFEEVMSQDEFRAQLRREQIHTEINANKIDIDRECFKHAFTDKVKLKEAKKSYNKLLGKDKKFENDRLSLFSYIIKSQQVIGCGELKMILN